MPRVNIKLHHNPPGTRFPWMTPELKELFEVLHKEIEDFNEFVEFMGDLLTYNELLMAALRWQIAKRIWEDEKSYDETAEELRCSTSTVTRVAKRVRYGEDGFRKILLRLVDTRADKKRIEREKKDLERIKRLTRPRYKGVRV